MASGAGEGAAGSGARELEDYLRREIPLSAALGAEVARLDGDGLELSAPLGPNLNHKRTAFGGSLYALAVLAAWGTVRGLLRGSDDPAAAGAHVVIVEGSIRYLRPVAGELRARCARPGPSEADAFLKALARKGKARIALEAEVGQAGEDPGTPAAVFRGVFAASAASADPETGSGRADGAGE